MHFCNKFSSMAELKGYLEESLELKDNTEMVVYIFKLPLFPFLKEILL